jgi:hypothetical protein
MILLETIALTQSAASVTFDNLPTSGYTDLKVVISARSTQADTFGSGIVYYYNGANSSLSTRRLYGQGNGTVGSTGGSVQYGGMASAANQTASTFGNSEVYIPNYRGSTNKSSSSDGVSENNATNNQMMLSANLWSNTAAITSITFLLEDSSNYVAGSTFSLYGIAALGTTPVLAPKATGGNSIENNGTYWIHTFTSSGTFIPQTGLTCDYLVVAGGGGGGSIVGAGGGAGGMRCTVTGTGGSGSLESALSLATGTAYTVTIGAGGGNNTAGSNSVFSTITSTGGGEGGQYSSDPGGAGGSGGGGGGAASSTTVAGGAASPSGQGFAGGLGIGNGSTGYAGGGGGGASAVGTNASAGVPGAGGNGRATSISGSSVTYAGGGGGASESNSGAGGTGGGGAGGRNPSTAATNGTANTGGGGGGARDTGVGATGGSGIVIIRYPIA